NPETNQLLKIFQYPVLKLIFIIGGILTLVLLYYLYKSSILRAKPTILLPVFIVFLINIPIFPEIYFIIEKSFPYSGFTHPQYFFWDIILISPQPTILIFTFLLLFFIYLPEIIQKQPLQVLYTLMSIAFLVYITTLNSQYNYTIFETFGRPSKINLFPNQSEDIFSLRTESNQKETYILDDVRTHQAFYDFKHAYVFDNLPWYLEIENNTNNKQLTLLEVLIIEKIEYIVILKENQRFIDDILLNLEITPIKTIESERFVIYSIK
ncbi:MAG: hypothetical protein N2D54_05415, partial [Chloroflexota bacterium]